MNKRLSKNFTLSEFVNSQTALRKKIDNTPSTESISNLEYLVINLLQPIRDIVGAININSGYRSLELNTAIGGSKTSQHMTGQAADIESFNYSNIELGQVIEKSGLEFDQLIYEFVSVHDPRKGWIHVSLKHNNNRQQVLWIQ